MKRHLFNRSKDIRRTILVADFERAVAEDEIVVYFQPQFHVRGEKSRKMVSIIMEIAQMLRRRFPKEVVQC